MRFRQRATLFTLSLMTMSLCAVSAQSQVFTSQPNGYGHSSVNPAGMPATFQQWPYVSPFQNSLEQHVNTDGLWMRRAIGGMRRQYTTDFNLDFTRNKVRTLKGIVGDPTALPYIANLPVQGGGGGGGGGGQQGNIGLSLGNYFNARDASVIPSVITNGISFSGGLWSPEGAGMMIDLNWGADMTAIYDARRGVLDGRIPSSEALNLQRTGGVNDGRPNPFAGIDSIEQQLLVNTILRDPFDDMEDFGFATAEEILDRNLLNLGGIPIQNGVTPGLGETIPFDMEFRFEHNVQTLGGAMRAAMSPVYESDVLKVHTTVGGRYYHIDEGFRFFGMDSGLAYGALTGGGGGGAGAADANLKLPPPNNGVDDDQDFVVDNVNESGATTFVQINPHDPIYVRALMDSNVKSSMGGPEIGLHYIIGKGRDGMQIVGDTRAGLMFNHEKININGDNITNFMAVDLILGPDPVTGLYTQTESLNTNNLNGPSQNAFADSRNNTHVSPLFEQTLTAELPIFGSLPVLRDVRQLEGAKLRLGYSYLWIGEVATPNNSIVWQSNPQMGLFPYVTAKRTSFSQNSFNIGLNWEY